MMEHKLAEFTKKDLKPGDILTTRNGARIYFKNNGYISGFGNDGAYLADDLTNTGVMGNRLDIVKVERPQVIWERPEEKTNEELHREMWNWLAEHPEKQKCDWFYKEDRNARDECFACEECNGNCDECPLDSEVIGCGKSSNGLYRIWMMSEDADVRKALSKVIAGLPWRSYERS